MRCSRCGAITPFFTDSTEPVADADITHRRHAIIETVFADLIDGPLAHMPSGRLGANSAWVLCAAIAHNLLRAAATLTGGPHAVARGATLRRKFVNIPPAWPAPNADPSCTCPATGPGSMHGFDCGTTPSDNIRHRWPSPPDQPPQGLTRTNRKAGQTSGPFTPAHRESRPPTTEPV
jgi:hypothetical protein